MTTLARTRALTRVEWCVLAEALALTPVAAVAVRLATLPGAAAFVQALGVSRSGSRANPRDFTVAPERLSALVEFGVSRLGVRCLVQAIVLQAVLRRRGIWADVVVGTTPSIPQAAAGGDSVSRIAAHAWVEYEGALLMGATVVRYVPLYRLTGNPGTRVPA